MQKTEVKTRFTPPADWNTALLLGNPIFADLCQRFRFDQLTDYPDIGWLNQCLPLSGISFVDNAALEQDGRYYEEYIYATRQVPTRKDNWHDFFGALIWCLFPKTKALLNKLHIAEIKTHGLKQRSKLRNKLTLLDECGVVLCLEPGAVEHAQLLRQHQWQHSFVMQRPDWWQRIRPVIFGHAIYEMATAPFIGLTAKALFIEVPDGFSQWPVREVYTYLDSMLLAQINGGILLEKTQLTPLPVLGVPGWYQANNDNGFYHNTDYFRPQRMG